MQEYGNCDLEHQKRTVPIFFKEELMAVIKMNFLSKALGFQTNISVILPTLTMKDISAGVKNYYQSGMKYQVLYLLHGGSGDYEDYIKFSNIVRYAEEHRLCVVMPCGYNSRYTDAGFGPRYFQYISEELPAVCRSMFPISGAREDTFAAGLSMGAQGAMKLGAMHPEKYHTILCMSGAAFNPDKIKSIRRPIEAEKEGPDSMPVPDAEALWGDLDKFKGSIHDAWHYARVNIERQGPKPNFYFAVGDLDINKDVVDEAYEYITQLGYSTHYEIVPGYGHEWDFWDLILRKAFEEKWFPLKKERILQ